MANHLTNLISIKNLLISLPRCPPNALGDDREGFAISAPRQIHSHEALSESIIPSHLCLADLFVMNSQETRELEAEKKEQTETVLPIPVSESVPEPESSSPQSSNANPYNPHLI